MRGPSGLTSVPHAAQGPGQPATGQRASAPDRDPSPPLGRSTSPDPTPQPLPLGRRQLPHQISLAGRNRGRPWGDFVAAGEEISGENRWLPLGGCRGRRQWVLTTIAEQTRSLDATGQAQQASSGQLSALELADAATAANRSPPKFASLAQKPKRTKVGRVGRQRAVGLHGRRPDARRAAAPGPAGAARSEGD